MDLKISQRKKFGVLVGKLLRFRTILSTAGSERITHTHTYTGSYVQELRSVSTDATENGFSDTSISVHI